MLRSSKRLAVISSVLFPWLRSLAFSWCSSCAGQGPFCSFLGSPKLGAHAASSGTRVSNRVAAPSPESFSSYESSFLSTGEGVQVNFARVLAMSFALPMVVTRDKLAGGQEGRCRMPLHPHALGQTSVRIFAGNPPATPPTAWRI